MGYQHIPTSLLRHLHTILALAVALGFASTASSQTATDICTYAAGNQYTVATSCTPQTFNKPNTFTNALLPTGCGATSNNDAWGWFTATGTTTNITYTPGSGNPRIHLFSGACGSLTQEACVNAGANGVAETITYATTIGVNYMVRIQSANNNAMNGTLCVWSPPVNDDPCAATALTVGTACSAIAGTNVSATATAGVPPPGCASYSTADVWYTFIAPAGGSINIETAPGTLTDGGVAIYSATACAGTYSLISCDDSNGPGNMGQAQATGLIAGQTYYARVWGNGGATGTFTICAHALANDNPCGATALTVGTACTPVSGTNVAATGTTGVPPPGCASYSTADVWYSFVAGSTGSIAVETNVGTLTDGGVAIYSATACGGTFSLLACDDNNGPGNMSLALQNGLTPGTTYYVRVWGNGGATGTFTICAYSLPNDNPCGATALTVGSSCVAVSSTNASATGSTGVPAPTCASYSTSDVWFTFVAPATGATTISAEPGGLTDGGMALYSATACNGTFTQIECDDNDGTGNMPSIARTGLTPGQTYYVRMWGNGGATGTFTICAFDPTPPFDNPCGATALTIGTSCTAVAGTTVGTTGTAIANPGCAAYNGVDVWYTTVVPANGIVTVQTFANSLTDGGLAAYTTTACNGTFTLLNCIDDVGGNLMPSMTLTGQTPGATIYWRFFGYNGATGTFSICATTPPPPANDNPCGAVVLTVGATCTLTAATNVGATGTAGIPAPGCAAYTSGDVWFSFVAPASGNVLAQTTANSLTDGGMALYSATACAGTFTLIECDDNDGAGNMADIQRTALIPGTTYYLRVWGNAGATGTFNICVRSLLANDDPCGATPLTVGSSCTTVAGTNVGATGTALASPGCAAYNGADVWFSTVVPANGTVTVQTFANTLADGGLAAYTATACGGTFTLLNCIDDVGGNLMPSITLNGQTPGTTIYWRFFGYNGAVGTFSICATTPPPPANDNPCGATALTVGTSCTFTSSTNLGATSTAVAAPPCASYTGGDVWFTAVAPASGRLAISTQAGGLTNSGMALYSATNCSTGITLISCNDDALGLMSYIIRTGLTPGTTYYIRVWGHSGSQGTFGICVTDPPLPPANDEPCNATSLSVTTTCTTITGNNTNGTPTGGFPVPGCGGTVTNDVWFTITAPASGFATVRVTPGTMTNPAIAVYAATSCSGGYQLLDCDDNNAPGNGGIITLTPGVFTPGQTYYVRVWSSSGAAGDFTLCAQTTTASCFLVLRLFDTNDNGWGGSRVTVQVGSATPVNYTIVASEGENTFYIPYTNGQLIQVSYATMGAVNQNQNSYFVQIGEGILYEGGPTPATGLVHASIPICGSLDPPQSDCSGGERLCSGTSFSANPSNTGAVVDLNLNTRGCLASDERQGSWYRFIPSAGGTIGMTIAPSNAGDDYDFAIWGPDDAHVCPPDVQPLRCSYSGTSGNTGLGNGAVDASEDSGGDKWVAPIDVVYGEHYTMYISNFSRSGLSFNLTWQLSNGASLDCVILPVELLSFTGEAVERTAELEWMTASESNSSHFVVERSTDGYTFAPIGEVTAAGTSNSLLAYSFVDERPVRGTNYYRLKQVDLDGTTDLSHIVPVTIDQLVAVGKPFPNPTHDRINLELQLTADQDLTFEVLDASGRLLHQENHRLSAGTVPFSTEVGQLEPGTYLLLVRDENGETYQTGRFVVE
jgi:hypothetical protein